jgi:unsaturated chondroitin disaccharide hydrolase
MFGKQLLIIAILLGCFSKGRSQKVFSPDQYIDYCVAQAAKTLRTIPHDSKNIPRSINHGSDVWRYVDYKDWCSGFWSGILWNIYAYTGDSSWKATADSFTRQLAPLAVYPGFDHDLGFMVFNSFGARYKLNNRADYKKIVLQAADSLATLFNPKVGTLLSWPAMVRKKNWPHNTIIDNMINLELLFWAAANGGNKAYYDMAVKHAMTTMKNHFRPDHSSYHVVIYDTVTGKKIKGVTYQGYADSSMWARGQSWAIYGFTMCYRETREPVFLDFAQKVADRYLEKLPADHIPYWDFHDPSIPDAPRDASAAAITASALLELSGLVAEKAKSQLYYRKAVAMLESLSSDRYRSADENTSFLLHSTGHRPAGYEIDASIIYADYYYLEALLRLKKMNEPVLRKISGW